MPRLVLSRGRAVGALALAACLVSGACSGGGGPEAAESTAPVSQDTAGLVTLNHQWPLTGLPVDGALPEHGVFAVKIDNTPAAAPQLGLASADMVVEELVEGGLTRLAAFFYSTLPADPVGPARSMRATDIGIVKPIDAILVGSGGASRTLARIEGAEITTGSERQGSEGFARDDSRGVAPYNLMVSLQTLSGSLKPRTPLHTYYSFGSEDEFPGGRPAERFRVVFSAAHTTSWKWVDGRGYLRQDSLAAAGDDFVPDSVLVLRVPFGDAGYLDPAGNPVPEALLVGEGSATLFHDGQMVTAIWTKKDATTPIQLRTADGPLTVPAGHVWTELIPATGASVSVR
jgi:Protein of unknown function (DUF3048) N-terminal domain/Protein of unknown function (DUF3048) C-terminal domain